ncbi:MAG: type I glutamate--ammonia ligase [Candidatus Cryosericum sp.]
MNGKRIYSIAGGQCGRETLLAILREHPEIRFVSLVAIDLAGNDTDERIPIQTFVADIDAFLTGKAVQTDGSSVVLGDMTSLADAQVDLAPDLTATWFVDYNEEHMDHETGLPVGTLRIPSFLVHHGQRIDSRSLLAATVEYARLEILKLVRDHASSSLLAHLEPARLAGIEFTVGTELEFWVKTPTDTANVEELSAAQILQENYWQRTRGGARTALEQAVMALEAYGLHPEMGHKEVGGVKAAIGAGGELTHVMEQMEIDWRYASALQAADNELLARILVKETFRANGLTVNFKAKPIPGVAGSGEHTHLGIAGVLPSGRRINLFAPADMRADFLSVVGYGALMGLLRNYEVVGPFISATNDAFNRLKPGFEAPVCIVAALGSDPATPSRNRTVLAGLVRDVDNPRATRFELRAPNPYTNTYLAVAASILAMLDGIRWALESGTTPQALLAEISKKPGDPAVYLQQERAYRSEENVFEHYSQEERDLLFGVPPATVWENMQNLAALPDRLRVLTASNALTPRVIDSFRTTTTARWRRELLVRIIPEDLEVIRACQPLDLASDRALDLWNRIDALRHELADDTAGNPSLCTRLMSALSSGSLEEASKLQVALANSMDGLRELEDEYHKLVF